VMAFRAEGHRKNSPVLIFSDLRADRRGNSLEISNLGVKSGWERSYLPHPARRIGEG
jgi:hypothetical protein